MGLKSYLKFRVDMRRWRNDRDNLESEYAHIDDLHESGDVGTYLARIGASEDWRYLILTKYWSDKADALGVSLPNFVDKRYWGKIDYDNDPSEPLYLTNEGLKLVIAAVREEQKHERERFGFWSTLLIGVIGAATGLVSAIASVVKG